MVEEEEGREELEEGFKRRMRRGEDGRGRTRRGESEEEE